MKAIVLSHDNNHVFADHMIQTYLRHWPSNPFQFRIPYQEKSHHFKEKFGDLVELIQTEASIKKTVLGLVSDLPDEEWVYWAVDDKYLIWIDEDFVNSCHSWVTSGEESPLSGLLFCRCRNLLDENNLGSELRDVLTLGESLYKRKNYYQFWVHQYLRVGIIRSIFQDFPDYLFRAREMDDFLGTRAGTPKLIPAKHKTYVTKNNYAVFGESTSGGWVTKNCAESLSSYGLDFPSGRGLMKRSIILGGNN